MGDYAGQLQFRLYPTIPPVATIITKTVLCQNRRDSAPLSAGSSLHPDDWDTCRDKLLILTCSSLGLRNMLPDWIAASHSTRSVLVVLHDEGHPVYFVVETNQVHIFVLEFH